MSFLPGPGASLLGPAAGPRGVEVAEGPMGTEVASGTRTFREGGLLCSHTNACVDKSHSGTKGGKYFRCLFRDRWNSCIISDTGECTK